MATVVIPASYALDFQILIMLYPQYMDAQNKAYAGAPKAFIPLSPTSLASRKVIGQQRLSDIYNKYIAPYTTVTSNDMPTISRDFQTYQWYGNSLIKLRDILKTFFPTGDPVGAELSFAIGAVYTFSLLPINSKFRR
jgi:hypothetical protein